jgi:hypothetical protein
LVRLLHQAGAFPALWLVILTGQQGWKASTCSPVKMVMKLGKALALNDQTKLVIWLAKTSTWAQSLVWVRTSLNDQYLVVIERGFFPAKWLVLVMELGNNSPWWKLFYLSCRRLVSQLADQ